MDLEKRVEILESKILELAKENKELKRAVKLQGKQFKQLKDDSESEDHPNKIKISLLHELVDKVSELDETIHDLYLTEVEGDGNSDD